MSASSPEPLANLHPVERRRRTQVWRRHVQARLADGQPSEAVAEAVRSDLERAGVESATVGATMALVNALRGDEERRPLLSEDHAWRAGRPPAGSPYRTRPLEPVAIERIRAELGRRGATLVSVMAYAGLAPDEAFTLRWSDVRADALSVETGWVRRSGHAQADRRRSVRLLPPVADDLAAWRQVTSHPDDHDPVFPHPGSGEPTDAVWRHWRRRRLVPALERAGLPRGQRVSDLRHTFALLLLEAGVPVADVARESGHGPLAFLSMYRGLVDEAGAHGPRSPAHAITEARSGAGRSGALARTDWES